MERRSPTRRVGVQALACPPSTLKRELQRSLRAGSETGAPPETPLPPPNWLSIDRRHPNRNGQEPCEHALACSGTKRKAGCFRRRENQTVRHPLQLAAPA